MKQMEVTTKEIGQATFYIKPFPAFVAANISGELTKLLTPIIGGVVKILGGDENGKDNKNQEATAVAANDILNKDIEQYIPSLVDAVSTLDGDKIESMMKKLLINHRNITVECEETNGIAKPLTYDLANEVFCNELQDMYLLCWEVIRLNFSGFFKKLGVRFGSLPEGIQTKIPSIQNGESLT